MIPMLVFWVAATVLIGNQLGWKTVHEWWDDSDWDRRILSATLVVVILLGSAAMLSVAERRILLLYRGSLWPPILERYCRLQEKHTRNCEKLRNADDADAHRRYPPHGIPLAATGLGNILSAAERYPDPLGRYALNGVLWWPRFFVVLPDSMRAELSAALTSMSLRMHISFVSGSYAILTAAAAGVFFVAEVPASWVLWCIATGSAAIVSACAYASTRDAALIYGDLIRTAFDLYRPDVLNRMGFALPHTLEAERQLWANLNKLIARGGVDTGGDEPLDAARARFVPKATM